MEFNLSVYILEEVQSVDPRLEWRALQEDMLRQYLTTAQLDLQVAHPHPQCFGSGSGSVWIRIIWSDPDPYQETIDMDPGSVKN